MPSVAELPTVTNFDLVKPSKPRSLLRPRPTFARVTMADVKAIAEYIAKRFTEKEACSVIGLPLDTWNTYKRKHATTISHIFEASRTKQLAGHLDVIEKAQTKDWRAADRLLSIKAPERFGKQESSSVASNVDSALVALVTAALDRVYGNQGTLAPAAQVIVDTSAQGSLSQSIVDVTATELPVDTTKPLQVSQPEGAWDVGL